MNDLWMLLFEGVPVMVFNATFNNISVILIEETGEKNTLHCDSHVKYLTCQTRQGTTVVVIVW
jgi:hypothetical protein